LISNKTLPFAFYALLILITAFLTSPTTAQENNSTTVPRFEPSDCPFPIRNGRTVECGYLVVPADHFNMGDEQFRLAVSILRSNHPRPLPDPILFMNGGPGAETAFIAGAEGLPLMADSRWDMIFLDQRGIGFSQPNLDCPAGEQEATTGFQVITGGTDIMEQLFAERRTAAERCHDYLQTQGYNLSLFNSSQIAADAAALRQALEIEALNIYAFSYGTIPAQLLLRDYPEGIRAVVLDSPVALEADFLAESPRQTAAAFQTLFAACNQDLACRVAYPDLETQLTAVVQQLNEEPITLTLTDETTGDLFHQVVTGDLLVGYIGSLTNSLSDLVRIPSLIYDLSLGESTQLAGLVGPDLTRSVALGNGMATSVFCHEFVRAGTAEAVLRAADGLPTIYTQAAVESVLFDVSVCEMWPAGTAAPGFNQPATGQTPTLVLSGQYDFGTPPAWGKVIANRLENGYFYEVPGVGHSVLGQECPVSVALAFLVNPTTTPPSRCLESMDQPEFTLSQATSRPWARTAVLLLMGFVMAAAGRSGLIYLRDSDKSQRPPFTWKTSLRLVNWLPTLAGAGLIGLAMVAANSGQILFDIPALTAGAVLGIVLPLVTAVQAASLFSPEDEPGLEISLAAPRPIAWTALERLALALLAQVGIGLVGTLIGRTITGTEEALWVTLARWFVPVIFFAGIGFMITLSSRHAVFGITMSTLSWFSLSLFGDNIVVRWPFLWPVHIFLKPETLTLDDYLLNRGLILALGLLMVVRGVYLLRNEEEVLFGRSRKSQTQVSSQVQHGTGLTNIIVTPESRANWGWYLAQIGSIARAELRLQWRRRAMLVLMLTLLVFPVLTAFIISGDSNQTAQSLVESGIITAEEARERIASAVTPFTFAPVYLAMLLMVPTIAAELIPKDRQLGVSELLESTPLTIPVYLVGKVLGFWLSGLVGLVSIMLVSMAAWRLILGPFAMLPVFGMWLVGGGSILIINGGLAVVLAAGQQSRRWAAFVGLIFAIGSVIMFSAAIGAKAVDFLYLNNLARPALLDYYMLASIRNAIASNIVSITESNDVWLTIAAGFAQLLLVGLLMWRWLVFRRGR
jgi:pimeloyl-ACP methyl ester carboxylesterase